MKSDRSTFHFHLLISLFVSMSLVSSDVFAEDSIPSWFSHRPEWHIGAELSPAFVPGTNGFLRGANYSGKRVGGNISGSARAGFSFASDTREGILYKDVYQGMGLGMESFFANDLLGTPVTAYVYQGAPIAHLSGKLWLGYEWKFGAAFGWKHYDSQTADNNAAVSTPVTAMMALGLKFHYSLTERWNLTFGIEGQHFSNGNTSWPNAGVNSIGASIGVSYILNPDSNCEITPSGLAQEADRGRWLYDIIAYGSWRKRVVNIGNPAMPQLCPGKFGVAGLQFSPMRSLNRYVAVGPALDLQWDESAGLEPYWVSGSYDENVKFYRPPFGKQISLGLSAHAELTMPIFSVNAGLGYDMISPQGNKRFYQSLTLKTFLTKNIFLNIGYRLGNFKHPQNLMLGVGVRL